MSTIHFLNVAQGDCSIIEHNSGRNTLIDVCNAEPVDVLDMTYLSAAIKGAGVRGDFGQKRYSVNPIAYLHEHNINNVFRYIQTHPDMDHMDGIVPLFDEFSPSNMWDTNNNKSLSASGWSDSLYSKEDWDFYRHLRDTNPDDNPKRLTLTAGAKGRFYNSGSENSGGDGLHILAPTQGLLDAANREQDDYHRCSYVLLYRSNGRRTVFASDSHDESWEHILDNHRESVTNIDLLIAPHHGRSSGRSYEFLDTLNPTATFFGNARAEDLAYGAWNSRNLFYITNNQANCMKVTITSSEMNIYVTNETFARSYNSGTSYHSEVKAWYLCSII